MIFKYVRANPEPRDRGIHPAIQHHNPRCTVNLETIGIGTTTLTADYSFWPVAEHCSFEIQR